MLPDPHLPQLDFPRHEGIQLLKLDDCRKRERSAISKVFTKIGNYPWTLGWIALAVTAMLVLMILDFVVR